MEKIKVGEYIRAKKGRIDRVVEITTEGVICEHSIFLYYYGQIVKHSPNIIDLIEVGDYVNGHRILEIHEALAPDDERILDIGYGMAIFVEDIKTIVTKEMFKNSEYEVQK